jgi:methanogenic corrinoid protein MtbC1
VDERDTEGLRRVAGELERAIDGGRSGDALAGVAALVREGVSATTIVREILGPIQSRVGERWQRAEWTVADEHRATAIVEEALGVVSVSLGPPGESPEVALVCAEGEWHVTPARMAALVLREAGLRVSFLGGSVPTEHLRRHLEASRPGAVALSCTVPFCLPGAAAVVAVAHEVGLPVVAGGRALDPAGRRVRAIGADAAVASAIEAVAVVRRWFDHPPVLAAPQRPDDADEHVTLELHADRLVAEAAEELRRRFPPIGTYDARQLSRTREDLAQILTHTRIALWAGDTTVLTEMLAWLDRVLEARGVEEDAVNAGLRALHGTLVPGWPAATRLLDEVLAGRQWFPGQQPSAGRS